MNLLHGICLDPGPICGPDHGDLISTGTVNWLLLSDTVLASSSNAGCTGKNPLFHMQGIKKKSMADQSCGQQLYVFCTG